MAEDRETIFTLEATPVKFGPGASADAGWELKRLGVSRALLVTDPGVAALGHPDRIKGLIEAEGIEVVLFDRSRVEPTLDSLRAFLADRLARYKVPRDVALVTELPRNPSGKLTKHVLRSRVREGTTVA